MSNLVLDSCVMAKLVLAEPDSEQAHDLCRSEVVAGRRLALLDVAVAETINAVWKQYHRGLIPSADAFRFVEYLLAVPVEIQTCRRLLPAAYEIAVKYDRSVYDALFVALVADLKLTGVTADEPLWQAVYKDHPNIVLLRDWKP